MLDILGKRRADVTPGDVDVMARVVERITAEWRDDLETTAGEPAWRRRLMDLGHDPLKPG